jgi:hypothetical protein
VTPTAPTIYDPLNNPLILAISDIEAIADGKITTFFQTSTPMASEIGDIWFDTDDANKMYRWSGTAWVLARDTGITTAIATASDALATADGKVTSFFQTSAPTAEAVGDLWFDTDDNNKLYRWNGSSWVLSTDSRVTNGFDGSGNIAGNKVITNSIINGAVNRISVASESGNITMTYNTEVSVNSLSITKEFSSSIVQLESNFAYLVGYLGLRSFYIYIYRNGSLVYTRYYGSSYTNTSSTLFDSDNFTIQYVDGTTGVGSVSYDVKVKNVDSSGAYTIVNQASLSLVEVKK